MSLALGLLFGAGVSRSISLGFYGVGSFILIMGFFAGNRGPARVKGEPGGGLDPQPRRSAGPRGRSRAESINLSFVFVALGALLIVFGVLADTRYSLF